jgi:murein DD-endopeptidase MepM/ murein hydrolase activator NlpD
MKNFKIEIKWLFKTGRFGFSLLVIILLSSLLVTFAQCPTVIPPEDNKVNLDGSATLELKGVATANFPPNSFSPNQELDITQTSDPDTAELFDEWSEFHKVHRRIDYEVRINTGENYPLTDEFEIVLNIPENFLSSVPQNSVFDLFVQVYQDGGMGILDEFELFPSNYNPENGELKAKLPYWVFTDTRTSDKTFEAIITLAATNFTAIDDTVMEETSSDLEERKCDSCDNALPIQCPLREIGCKETSRFNTARLHPVYNVVKPHFGVDLSTDEETGKKVYAAANGVVIKVWNSIGGGLNIWIQHTDKSDTIYRHLKENLVNEGENVSSETIIARSGDTGIIDGPHLHFEYRPYCKKILVDPYPCIVPTITENSFIIGGAAYKFSKDAHGGGGVGWGTSISVVDSNNYSMDIGFGGTTPGTYEIDFTHNRVFLSYDDLSGPDFCFWEGKIVVLSYGNIGETISGYFSGKGEWGDSELIGASGKFSVIREF